MFTPYHRVSFSHQKERKNEKHSMIFPLCPTLSLRLSRPTKQKQYSTLSRIFHSLFLWQWQPIVCVCVHPSGFFDFPTHHQKPNFYHNDVNFDSPARENGATDYKLKSQNFSANIDFDSNFSSLEVGKDSQPCFSSSAAKIVHEHFDPITVCFEF